MKDTIRSSGAKFNGIKKPRLPLEDEVLNLTCKIFG